MIRIVGIGGTTSALSATESALRLALERTRIEGAEIELFGSEALVQLPHYGTAQAKDSPVAKRMIEAVRQADGLLLASPGYHGTISGLVKNAIDYLEDTARDSRVYLDGMPVGIIVTAYGWQATGSTLAAMRSVVHALRGWPTPIGVAIKSYSGLFSQDGCASPEIEGQLDLVGRQVVEMCRLRKSTSVNAVA
jgi:FMN reductase